MCCELQHLANYNEKVQLHATRNKKFIEKIKFLRSLLNFSSVDLSTSALESTVRMSNTQQKQKTGKIVNALAAVSADLQFF